MKPFHNNPRSNEYIEVMRLIEVRRQECISMMRESLNALHNGQKGLARDLGKKAWFLAGASGNGLNVKFKEEESDKKKMKLIDDYINSIDSDPVDFDMSLL